MSDTPETDKEAVRPWMDLQNMTTHARRLERERDEARRMAEDQRNQHASGDKARLVFPWEVKP